MKMYVLCTLESPNRGDSNELLFHRRTKSTSLNYLYLPPDLALCLTVSGSSYLCLEQICMVLEIQAGVHATLKLAL